MLTRLCLRNYLFVDDLEIRFGGGLNVLTGETGAGKSLLVGALSLLAGGKAAGGRVSPAAGAAEVEAAFALPAGAAARLWLRERALADADDEGALLVRRVIGGKGKKSNVFINGRQMPLAQAAAAVSLTMDICGQHAHYSLRGAAAQRDLLDNAAGVDAAGLRAAYRAWRAAAEKLRRAEERAADDAARRGELSAALAELDAADFSAEKWRDNNDNLTRAAHAADLANDCAETLKLLDGDDTGAQAVLSRARRVMAVMRRRDARLSDTAALLDEASDRLNEAASALSSYAEKLTLQPEVLRAAEDFIAECHRLARKYRLSDPSLLAQTIEEKRAALAALSAADDVAALRRAAAAARQTLDAACGKATAARKKAARRLAGDTNAHLKRLAMAKARLSVELTPLAAAGESGAEKARFLFVARDDLPPGDIADVASGGELSRLGLAVQLAAGGSRAETVSVFDEVDAGIGGATAGVVGALLKSLGERRQVLCVTHLPQVAACAHAHWRVGGEKLSLRRLSAKERVEELARMHSGEKITAAARKHAAEMLAQAGGGGGA